MMKQTLTILFTLFLSSTGFAQDDKDFKIFKNTKNWKREMIKFPVEWAPTLNVTGFEELLFTPKWSDSKNEEFWSLVIGWKIDTSNALELKKIESNFKAYFDGLMIPNHWAKKFPKPVVNFKKSENGFVGKMTFFDGFHTGKVITVNIKGKQLFSQKNNESVIVFRLSTKEFSNKVWNSLNDIQLTQENRTLINLDNSWGNETFEFPISFAPNINYKGVAEVRFPKGWINPEHPNFWSYTYVWKINMERKIDASELAKNLELYFDGLNNINQNKNLQIYKAVANIIKIKSLDNNSTFIGRVTTYDRFATNKKLILNVLIDSYYHPIKKQGMIHFKFSPKEFGHKTWEMLAEIELNKKE
jgi:hypothetical protein